MQNIQVFDMKKDMVNRIMVKNKLLASSSSSFPLFITSQTNLK